MIEEEYSLLIAFKTKKTGNTIPYETLRLMTYDAVEFVAAESATPTHWFRRAYIAETLC